MVEKLITDRTEYNEVMKQIESLLQLSTKKGGSDNLPKADLEKLEQLSLLAEKYEDSIPLMPIKAPATLTEMIRFKMFEMNLKQNQLATLLEISEARISELLNGKRKLNIAIAKKLYKKLDVDASFLLDIA